jgi:uncharacterized protein (TIGR03086 family)
MDTVALIQAAAPTIKGAVSGIEQSQHGNPTPCAEFDVKGLSNHFAGFWGMSAKAARKQAISGGSPNADHVGSDPGGVLGGLVDDCTTAWQEEGATEGKTQFGPGEFDASMAAQITLLEGVVHAWDLAVATGRSIDVPADVAEGVLGVAQAVCQPEQRGPGKPFGPEVPVDASASAFNRALGLTGRDPAWSA